MYEIDSHERTTVGSVLAAIARSVARPFVREESAFGIELRDGIERVNSEKDFRGDPDLHLRQLSTLMTRRMSRGHCHHVLEFLKAGGSFADASNLGDLGRFPADLITPIALRNTRRRVRGVLARFAVLLDS